MVKDHLYFLKKIKKLKLYIVKFNKNNIMKRKVYFYYYILKSKNQ